MQANWNFSQEGSLTFFQQSANEIYRPKGRYKKKESRNFQIDLWAELNAPKGWYLKNGVFIDEDIKNRTELLPKRG
jgi:hypothetical protein